LKTRKTKAEEVSREKGGHPSDSFLAKTQNTMKKANPGCYPNTDMKTYLHHSFTITSYSVGVCLELQKALNGLVGKRSF